MGVTTGEVKQLSTIQVQANLPESIQFGRIIEVIITNFKLNKAVKLGTDFDIDFEFTKTCDEVREASTGTVTIKNLTKDTLDIITMRNECQMQLFCGYNQHTALLFVADIISSTVKTNGTNVDAVFVVSANFFQYKLAKTVSFSVDRGVSIVKIMDAIMDAIRERKQEVGDTSSTSYVFDIPHYWLDEDKKSFLEYIQTASVTNNYSVNDDLQNILTNFCTSFGFTVTTSDKVPNTTGEVYVFSFAANFENHYLNKSKEPYQKVKNAVGVPTDAIFSASDTRVAITLSYQTGMLNTPEATYQIFTVPENWKLDANSEEQTFESKVAVANKNAKEQERYQKYLKSSAKKVENGKVVKPFKKRKQGNIKIRKTFINVRALINPNVRPQSIINLVTEDDELTGLFRVRSVRFSGSNYSNNFYMDILMDDTNGAHDKKLSDEEAQKVSEDSQSGFGADVEIGGNIGDGYSEVQNVIGSQTATSE